MSKQVITTNDVAIKQIEVSVQVLKIGNKQVTQSVFKQLPEQEIFSYVTGKLRGEAWGRVNYHVDCKGGHHHFHVVWQMGNQLYRSVVAYYDVSWKWKRLDEKTCKYAIAYLAARVLGGWIPETPLSQNYTLYPSDDWSLEVDEGQKGIYLNLPKALTGHWYYSGATRNLGLQGEAAYPITGILERCKVPNDSQVIREKFLVPALYEQRIYESVWQQSYDQLQQLDQLFIAV